MDVTYLDLEHSELIWYGQQSIMKMNNNNNNNNKLRTFSVHYERSSFGRAKFGDISKTTFLWTQKETQKEAKSQ